MNYLLAPVSKSISHSMPSNNFPTVYYCSDIGNFSSALILLALVMSILPKYVMLKSEFSLNLVVLSLLTGLLIHI